MRTVGLAYRPNRHVYYTRCQTEEYMTICPSEQFFVIIGGSWKPSADGDSHQLLQAEHYAELC